MSMNSPLPNFSGHARANPAVSCSRIGNSIARRLRHRARDVATTLTDPTHHRGHIDELRGAAPERINRAEIRPGSRICDVSAVIVSWAGELAERPSWRRAGSDASARSLNVTCPVDSGRAARFARDTRRDCRVNGAGLATGSQAGCRFPR